MILFKKDYAHLDETHIHLQTKNRSFVRMHAVLKRMGIKNNLFHLILLDPDLADIDPHNLVDNSEELKLKIVREAKTNPYYIFRELLRIHEIGTDGVRFKVNRGNLSIIWLYFNHIDNLVIAPRQTLKTVTATSIIKIGRAHV